MGEMIHFRETGDRDAVSTFKEKGGELFGQDEIVEGEIKRNKENKKTKTFDFGLKFFWEKISEQDIVEQYELLLRFLASFSHECMNGVGGQVG